eukprot:GHVU01000552.1.p1 GENE.GHVU01000552.1~~GHVU01000552.1.p1  ORF type:complete len:499 (-),score=99.99 GHVU01000552.1:666-2162(-)
MRACFCLCQILNCVTKQWYTLEGPSSEGELQLKFAHPHDRPDAEEEEDLSARVAIPEPEPVVPAVTVDPTPGVVRMELIRGSFSGDAFNAMCAFQWRGRKEQTSVVTSTNMPEWNDRFEMPYDPVIDPQHAELRVHSSEGSGDIVVGTAKIDLTKTVFNERMEEWYEVVKEDSSVAGHIALGLLKQTEFAVEEQANISPRLIKLTIVGARSLVNANAFGKSDPYVTFQWRGQEFNTEVINDNCDPDCNQDFELPLPASDPPNLELQVMDTDFATNDDWLGGINVSLLDDLSVPVESWYYLDGLDNPQGQTGIPLYRAETGAADRGIQEAAIETDAQQPPYATLRNVDEIDTEVVEAVEEPSTTEMPEHQRQFVSNDGSRKVFDENRTGSDTAPVQEESLSKAQTAAFAKENEPSTLAVPGSMTLKQTARRRRRSIGAPDQVQLRAAELRQSHGVDEGEVKAENAGESRPAGSIPEMRRYVFGVLPPCCRGGGTVVAHR